MGSYSLKILFAISVCFLHTNVSILGFNSLSQSSHVKCIESERQALLNFKHGLRDDDGILSTWSGDDNNTDCCKWKGIQCNNQTGHVLMLHLRGDYPQYLQGAINITSFIHLPNIQYLDLSYNNCLMSDIPKLIGSFKNLRYLKLSGSNFAGGIPSELGNLSKLDYLDLCFNDLDGTIPSQLGKLTSLRYLGLSYNRHIQGELPYQLGNLSQLTYLDLEGGLLSGAIPFQVGNLPILRTLRLGGNFDLTINFAKWLSSLSSLTTFGLTSLHNLDSSHYCQQMIGELIPNLTELVLSNCSITDKSFVVLSSSIKNSSSSLVTLDLSYNNLLNSSVVFHRLFNFTPNLEFLDLRSNKLQGKIPMFFENMCRLKILTLSHNNLSGEISNFIPNSPWCNRHVFLQLDLSYNCITGMLPNLSIFTSLASLDLSYNQLTGEIPKSIGLLHELEDLYLVGNYLEGDITELHLRNLSKLEGLDLSDNSLSIKFGNTWVPPFQLHKLGLASCKLGPSFPSWLHTQNQLGLLDISDAGIDDFVPDWFWRNKLPLMSIGMNMSCNNLRGTIPNLPTNLDTIEVLILNSNQFEGHIPSFLSQATTLDLSQNKFSDLNTFLCRKSATTKMRTLDLSHNQIIGQLPDCWEGLSSLTFLDLGNNKLSGKIPQSIGNLVNLEALVLRKNNLTGDLPFQLKNCVGLVILDVSENLLSGPIPSWIGESLQQLKILSVRVNHFFGSVPTHICFLRQIHFLDLSRNNLSGGIPACLKNFTAMMEGRVITSEIVRKRKMSYQVVDLHIYVSNVLLMWKGQDHEFWNPEYLLKAIDLSSNDLKGEIPKEVGYLLGLVSLNLARNNLHGEIPSGIGNLTSLDFLNLSGNHFSGKIPSSLSKIDGLGKLDLSNNDLSGRIPWEGHLQTFDASSFEGNLDLCGEPLNRSCPGDEATSKPQGSAVHDQDDNSVFYEALYMSLGIGFFAGFWGLLGPILLWQPWRTAYGRFLNKLIDNVFVMVQVNIAKCHRWLKG